MKQRVHLITLGVEDTAGSARFYDAMGWQRADNCPPGIVAYDLYGATLGLYPHADLAREIGMDLQRGSGAMTLSCNVREKPEVADVLAAAQSAGGALLKDAHDVFWGGHIGYFADPDGHIWEVAFNPFSALGEHDEFQWNGT